MYFIVPNRVEDNVFIDTLSEVVATGLRKLYSIICVYKTKYNKNKGIKNMIKE